jgi:hypothetical protein
MEDRIGQHLVIVGLLWPERNLLLEDPEVEDRVNTTVQEIGRTSRLVGLEPQDKEMTVALELLPRGKLRVVVVLERLVHQASQVSLELEVRGFLST